MAHTLTSLKATENAFGMHKSLRDSNDIPTHLPGRSLGLGGDPRLSAIADRPIVVADRLSPRPGGASGTLP